MDEKKENTVNIGGMVEETLKSDMAVWVEFTEGFKVQIRFVGREKFQKMYEKCVKFDWNPKSHRREEIPDREKFLRAWAEKSIKSWEGLTLGKLAQFIPIKIGKDDNPKSVVPPSPENKLILLKHNAEFDDFVLSFANSYSTFQEAIEEVEAEAENLKP